MFKKIAIAFAVVVVLVVGALLVIPFFVSVDQFRPQIQTAVEKQIRGKVELGKISLSLFPTVKIKIDGAKITPPAPFQGDPLAVVKSIEVRAPLTALFTAPAATIALVGTDVTLVSQGPTGKSSLTETLPPVEANPPPQGAVGETLNSLPPFIRSRVDKARLSFKLEHTNVILKDQTAPKGNKTEVHDLALELTGIGLSVPMKLDMTAAANVVMGAITVAGKIKADGNITFKPVNKDNIVDLDVKADLAGLDIGMKPLFHKPVGTAFETVAQGTVVQNAERLTADMKKLGLIFGQLNVGGTLKADLPTADANAAKMDARFAVNDFDISSFGAMIPMVKDYKLNGKSDVNIAADGSLTNPNLNIKVVLKNLSGATPQLAKPLSNLNGVIAVSGTPKNPSVLITPFSMKLGASDLGLKLETHGIQPISVAMSVNSSLLNADELLGLQPLKIEPAKGTPTQPVPPAQTVAAQPLDASLDQLAPTVDEALKNPMLDTIDAKILVDMKKIIVLGAEFQDAALNMTYAKRKVNVSKTGIKGYGGLVTLAMALDLDPKALGFDVDAGLKDVQIGRALAAHMPSFKDVMSGNLNGTLKINGKGLHKEQIASNLRGGLKGEVTNGRLNFPIVQLISGAVDSLPKIAGKKLDLPAKQKTGAFQGDFKTCGLDTAFEGRKVLLKNLDVTFNSAQATNMGDIKFKADGSVTFDRQLDLLGTAFLSPEIVRVAELKGPSGQIEIPLKVKGDISDPKPDYAYTVKVLGERAFKNIAGKATEELKARATVEVNKAKAQAEEQAKAAATKAIDQQLKNAPAPVQKQADELKKKLKKFHL